jgi:hypothetical protein
VNRGLETPILPPDAHNDLVSFEREISYKNGDMSTQKYKRPAKLGNLYRSCYATLIGLSFPHLFKGPASYHEFRSDWTANDYGCHSVVPWSFRRDILDRLIDMVHLLPVLHCTTRDLYRVLGKTIPKANELTQRQDGTLIWSMSFSVMKTANQPHERGAVVCAA